MISPPMDSIRARSSSMCGLWSTVSSSTSAPWTAPPGSGGPGRINAARESPTVATHKSSPPGFRNDTNNVDPEVAMFTLSRSAASSSSASASPTTQRRASSARPAASSSAQWLLWRKKGMVLASRSDGQCPFLPWPSKTPRTSQPTDNTAMQKLSWPKAKEFAPLKPLLLIAATPHVLIKAFISPFDIRGHVRHSLIWYGDSPWRDHKFADGSAP
mmetsp:Transcript_42477/g.123469  ORF Transcript_42477/g.123469 Transcript_42477/m.123469 type:complete len:215 (+) Transcript_42477:755-1399(+)